MHYHNIIFVTNNDDAFKHKHYKYYNIFKLFEYMYFILNKIILETFFT